MTLPRGSKTYVMKKILKALTGGSTDHNIFLQIFTCIALKVERPGRQCFHFPDTMSIQATLATDDDRNKKQF